MNLLIFSGAAREASAQQVTTATALPGVPITQEPHHHLVLHNSLVNVYEVEVAPGDATLIPECWPGFQQTQV